MKKIFVIAALAAVTACSDPAPAPQADASAAAETAAPAAATVAADGKPSFGTFKITTAKGEVLMEEVKADGTYVATKDGKVVETGKWEQKSPSVYCTTEDKQDAVQQCNEEKVENGVYTSKSPDGEVATIERVEG